MTERPEIEVNNFFPGTFEAECPIAGCNWFEHSNLKQEVEDLAAAHQQWHEDGMPE